MSKFIQKVQKTYVKADEQPKPGVPWHPADNLLDGITFQELIDTVHSNEKEYTEATVRKVYNEIVSGKTKDAREMLNAHMKDILVELHGVDPEKE